MTLCFDYNIDLSFGIFVVLRFLSLYRTALDDDRKSLYLQQFRIDVVSILIESLLEWMRTFQNFLAFFPWVCANTHEMIIPDMGYLYLVVW